MPRPENLPPLGSNSVPAIVTGNVPGLPALETGRGSRHAAADADDASTTRKKEQACALS